MNGPAAVVVRAPIPAPPPDPALGALGTALDGDAVAALLARRLPDCTQGAVAVESCRPRYIRYKPGTNCLVQYEVVLRAGPDRFPTLAHVRLYAGAQAQVLWASRSYHRLIEQGRQLPGPLATRAAPVPELNGLCEVFPVDRKMPGLLAASSADAVRTQLLSTLGESGAGHHVDQVDVVRYKPGRKAVLRYRLHGGARQAVYGRVHADHRGRRLLAAGRALVAAGVPAPEPIAYVDELGLLLVEEAPGRRLADLPDAPYEQWLPAVARALAGVHTAPVGSLAPLAHRNKEGGVLAAARTLATVNPRVGPAALRLGATLAAQLTESSVEQAVVHGDFYDDQVLIADDGVVLLDFDASGTGNPLLDVGNFLAHVLASRGERCRDVFLDAYLSARPESARELALFEAAAMLRIGITPFRWLWPTWREEVERRVALAVERFAEHRRPVPFAVTAADSRLPQLDLLRDHGLVGRELQRLLAGDPVEVLAATLVRHKPGRRCVFRYHVRCGPPGQTTTDTLYGKVFASGRGPAVYERLRAVASTAACGPGVRIPEPIGYVAGLKLLIQRAVPGEPAPPSLLAGDEELAAQIADALGALHRSRARLDRRHGINDELAPLAGRVERIADRSRLLASRARRCLALAAAGARHGWGWRWRPVHRDFYHDQVLVSGGALSVLDWDDAAMSEPAVDVANFRAHLYLLALQRPAGRNALARVTAAFDRRISELDDELDPDLVRFLEGTTLLRLAEIHQPRARGEQIAAALLAHSAVLLRS